tara:strand:- start:86 stop:349 length:264 start_codon:yes stop_codon:yes gene_type:complete
MAKKFEPHMMYGEGKSKKANTYKEHLELKEKGWGHTKPSGIKYGKPGPFKMKSPLKKQGPCWDGFEMYGTKMKDGEKVPNCIRPPKK